MLSSRTLQIRALRSCSKAVTGSRAFSAFNPRLSGFNSPAKSASKDGQKNGNPQRPMRERMSLEGKTTVITGGARGIGLSLVEAIAEAGGNVAILDVLEKPQTDLSALGDRRDEDRCTGEYFQSDKAGFWECRWLVLGTFFCAQLAAKAMKDQVSGGSLVFIASIASHMALPLQRLPMYGATKGAVRVLMTQLAVELGPLNIRVNSVSPGFIRTDMTKLCAVQQPELYSIFDTAPPIGRIGETSDITGAVNYLLSDASAYTTGADIPITGGLIGGRIKN
ncbi:hypothetical protein OPT61_g3900 [Boeremia exigua]|uniref:Uncharacterized protein n=1 Tax=Boeremia exigua TaxID=749465 RepID=A0ACC2IG40_9PLEO|nr:hypothetical protein OPT61_g3900 [Boeremia exigua]